MTVVSLMVLIMYHVIQMLITPRKLVVIHEVYCTCFYHHLTETNSLGQILNAIIALKSSQP